MPRDNAERKPPSQGALTSEEVRARIAGVLRSETEISAARIAARIGVSLARVNGHLTALDLQNLVVRCNGVGPDGQRVTLWRAAQLRSKKVRRPDVWTDEILRALFSGPMETQEIRARCGGGRDASGFQHHLVQMERRGLIVRTRPTKRTFGPSIPDIWSLPPPPARLGDDGDVQSPSVQSKTRKAIP